MKLITILELENKTELELSALFAQITHELIRSERGSPERRSSLASLENINIVRRNLLIAGFS